jgi:hypothetical protein
MPTPRPGPEEPARQGPGGRVWRLLPILIVAAVAGCAQPGTQPLGADATITSVPPATVTVGPDDDGRAVDLEVGDWLIVELAAAKQPSRFPSAWTLELPPSNVLRRVDRDVTRNRVVFVADAPGTVRLILLQRRGCDPPLQCPLAGPSGQGERMHPPLPALVVTITVRVQ